MNKKELIEKIAKDTNFPNKDVETIVSKVIDTIQEEVASGNQVVFTGFGTFERKERAERDGRNPRTNETIKIPAKKVPHFSAGKTFKEKVNN